MLTRGKGETGHALKGGIIAGIIGGLAMVVFLAATRVGSGANIWPAFKAAGAPLMGERALSPGFDAGAVVVGFIAHFAVSIVWGALFGVLAYGLSRWATLAAGFIWGLVVWAVMFYAVLPLMGLRSLVQATPGSLAVLEHLLFGLAVAVGFLPYQRRELRPIAAGPRRVTP